jgi:hypothetical protein
MTFGVRDFETTEGRFHDGLGTYAEIALANALIARSGIDQAYFDTNASRAKMFGAVELLPSDHNSREIFRKEISNIEAAATYAAASLLEGIAPACLMHVRHTATLYSGGVAGDLLLEMRDHPAVPVSVKTDKSGKVAVADGQTPDISFKWAARYFSVTTSQLDGIVQTLGYPTIEALKMHYLNVAELVAQVLILKLGLVDCSPTDFSRARATNLEAIQHLFRQLLAYKRGSDGSHVLIFNRTTGAVSWETLLDAVDIDSLSLDQISFRPSCPRAGRRVGSEFGIKVDGKAVVTFQVKHRRGKAHGTVRQSEFLDITTRLTT